MPSKREIDKQNMFRKIMPSAAAAQDGEANREHQQEQEPAANAAPDTQAAPVEAAASASVASSAEPPSVVEAPVPAEPPSSRMLTQDEIAALFAAQMDNDVPDAAEPAPEPTPEPMATAEAPPEPEPIIAAEAAPLPEPAAEAAPTLEAEGGKLSQDAIAALFAAQQNDETPAAAPEPPLGPNLAAIAEAMAQQESEAPPAATAGSAPTLEAEGGKLSQDAIAALFAAQQDGEIPSAASQPPPLPEPPQPSEPKPVIAAETIPQPAFEPEPVAVAEAPPEPAPALVPPVPSPFSLVADAAPEAPAPATPAAQAPADPGAPLPYPVNLAELLVDKSYPRYRQKLDACSCQRCRDDACGIALNKITPRYVPSDQLDPARLSDREMTTEAVTALVKAIFLVKRSPRHNETAPMRQ